VPAATVAKAAGWLREIDPDGFDWLADDYRQWRSVYLEAATWGEAIVVG
jgi:hypothetical protein